MIKNRHQTIFEKGISQKNRIFAPENLKRLNI